MILELKNSCKLKDSLQIKNDLGWGKRDFFRFEKSEFTNFTVKIKLSSLIEKSGEPILV